MPHKFIHVGFTFFGAPKVKELEPVFNAIGDDWIRYSANCWILYTPRSASDVFYFLKPRLSENDQMLILGLDMNEMAAKVDLGMDRSKAASRTPSAASTAAFGFR